MMCRVYNLGRYIDGQGHSMTLQQNRVRPINCYLKSDFKTFQRNDHHIEMTKFLACVQNLFGKHHPIRPALVFQATQVQLYV